MFHGTRSLILKLITIIVFVMAVDQTIRKQILKSPGSEVQSLSLNNVTLSLGEVVEKYMLKVGLHIQGGLTKVQVVTLVYFYDKFTSH